MESFDLNVSGDMTSRHLFLDKKDASQNIHGLLKACFKACDAKTIDVSSIFSKYYKKR